MDDSGGCAICGNPIERGQSWMEATRDGERIRAHSACLYTDERNSETAWEPQERTAQ
jgi:ribosomal protein L24E